MSRSGKDFFGEYEKYGGEYEDMIREEIAALQEEEERLTESLEEKQKEYKDGDNGEIRKLQERIDEIGKEKSELLRGANDAKMMEEIAALHSGGDEEDIDKVTADLSEALYTLSHPIPISDEKIKKAQRH